MSTHRHGNNSRAVKSCLQLLHSQKLFDILDTPFLAIVKRQDYHHGSGRSAEGIKSVFNDLEIVVKTFHFHTLNQIPKFHYHGNRFSFVASQAEDRTGV